MSSSNSPLLIVGLGASAGGLQAFSDFLAALPEESGLGFILVQHLDPDQESVLAELLQEHTTMPVATIEDGMAVLPDHVYVVPPAQVLSLRNGVLHLTPPRRTRDRRYAIDTFFRSLGRDQGERAVGVLLSGTGTDGTLGLESIKEKGGLALAQSPEEAVHGGMPQNAIDTGLVDFSAPAAELARRLVSHYRGAGRLLQSLSEATPASADEDLLPEILGQLRAQTGHDFTPYKQSTILRRLARRMQISDADDMAAYLRVLRARPAESQALLRDFLISVTSFFRDPAAFEAIERDVVPALFDGKQAEDAVRVWVPGCATGEEAYSLAMLLLEHADGLETPPRIQVFATDLDVDALSTARKGRYSDAVEADIAPERLRRFFSHEERGYRVGTALQDVVRFAHHNLIKDPPFSNLDLVSCRNLLIYLERGVQNRLLELFGYALRDDGYLFLGSSESADSASELFQPVRKEYLIFRRIGGPRTLPTMLPLHVTRRDPATTAPEASRHGTGVALGELHRDLMLQRYAPPSVIVDQGYDVRYLFGEVGRFLRPQEGEPTTNLLQLVGREMRVELRTALFQLFHRGQEEDTRLVRWEADGRAEEVVLRIQAIRQHETPDALALVVFEQAPKDPQAAKEVSIDRAPNYDANVVGQLEDELQRTKYRLQAVIEEYETSNQELKASNEELQSMNEELRSTSEELETSREELQSTNEELHALNKELKTKIDELNITNADLRNLMASTEIGTLFLDQNLGIKRFTPAAKDLFHLIEGDVGRPFEHITHVLEHDALPELARKVLTTGARIEEEVRRKDGRWFLMRAQPYRTVEDQVDGVVMTLVDITERRTAQEEERARARHQAVLAEMRQYALTGTEPGPLKQQAVRQVARTLALPLAEVLALEIDGKLDLRAGYGWKESDTGLILSKDDPCVAGYVLTTKSPVVFEDLAEDSRFQDVPRLREHRVVSGVCVVIQGAAEPYGVLGAYATRRRSFTEQEVHFMQEIANLLGLAIERYLAERAMRGSEARFRALVDATAQIVWTTDADGTVQEESESWRAFTGQSFSGSTREERLQYIHPEDREGVRTRWAEALESRKPISAEYRLRHVSGHWRWTQMRAVSLYAEDGTHRGWVGMNTDVNEQKEAELALRESEQRFRVLASAVPVLIWRSGTDGSRIWFNDLWLSFTGRELEEEVGDGWAEGVHPDDRQRYAETCAKAVERREAFETEYRLRHHSGEFRWIMDRGVPFEAADGSFTGFLGGSIDIHERKQAEAALQRSEARYRAIFETSEVSIWEQDFSVVRDALDAVAEQGVDDWGVYFEEHPEFVRRAVDLVRILDVNEATVRLFGASTKEDLLDSLETIFTPEALGTFQKELLALVEGRHHLIEETELQTLTGEYRHVIVTMSLPPATGSYERVLVSLMDITAQKEAELALRRSKAQLAALNEELEKRVEDRTRQVRTLASSLTLAEQRERHRVAQILHDDLQQLLYGTHVQLHMLRENLQAEPETAAEALRRAVDALKQAIAVARTLTVDLSPPVLKGEGLAEAIRWLGTQMRENYGLRVDVEVEGRLSPSDQGMRVLLFQLVRELLFNVVKHASVSRARVSLHQNARVLRIEVSDEGDGFDVGSLLREGEPVRGFGLYSVRERLGLFGGSLSISSNPGEGTVATITAPVHPLLDEDA